MSTMCYPYGSGITCVCDGGGVYVHFFSFIVLNHFDTRKLFLWWMSSSQVKEISFEHLQLQAAIYFGVFRTSVRRRQRRQKEEELLIGLREYIGGHRRISIIFSVRNLKVVNWSTGLCLISHFHFPRRITLCIGKTDQLFAATFFFSSWKSELYFC